MTSKPDAPFGLPISPDTWLYYLTLALSLAIYAAAANLLSSRTGRAMMAIRDNEIAASAMGVDIALYKTLAFGISAAITGIAGALGAIAVQFVAPDGYTFQLSIALFLGTVVGGVGWLPRLDRWFRIHCVRSEYRGKHFQRIVGSRILGVLILLVIFVIPRGARQIANSSSNDRREKRGREAPSASLRRVHRDDRLFSAAAEKGNQRRRSASVTGVDLRAKVPTRRLPLVDFVRGTYKAFRKRVLHEP